MPASADTHRCFRSGRLLCRDRTQRRIAPLVSSQGGPDINVWPPHLNIVFRPDPDILPGVQGDARFVINSSGIRGDELADDQNYRILAIGGSTTECAYLDQGETWPYLLQNRLARVMGQKVWVGNVGKSGMNTRDHILHTKYLLPQFPKIDAVLLLVGVE